ncbi:MAG: family 43 glycosylhydrolase [Sedimentisphaerales bacterium]|nr:family 43 glycosylhydrolase [Sedimentisphaerales bacterium]
MKKNLIHGLITCVSLIIITSLGNVSYADNPITQTIFTADPAPMIYDGTLYLYTGHDEDIAPSSRFIMHDYQCFSTTDMVNWTHHGAVLDIRKVFAWSGGDANAAQCIYRNGKFYYYVSTANTQGPGGVALGVAVSDSPFGPFKDALGKSLVTNNQTTAARHSWDDLDPSIFIDNDDRAWLYWGNNACYYAELNDDMISLKSEISHIELTKEAFGPDFEEAPWIYRHGDMYYLWYASNIPESIHYSIASSPTGPWKYGGEVMKKQETTGSNHPGIIEYKGHSYLFYQTDSLPNGIDKRRSVCAEEFKYNDDGSVSELKIREDNVTPIGTIDPRTKIQAETMAWAQGIETEKNETVGVYVTDIDNYDYIKIRQVDFGNQSPGQFQASVASGSEGGHIDVRIDSLDGRLLGRIDVENTGDWQTWKTLSCRIKSVTGIHDLYLVFSGGNGELFNIDWWQFE